MSDKRQDAPLAVGSESLLEWVFETLPSGLMLIGSDGEVIKINRQGRQMLALDESMNVGRLPDFPAYLNPLRERLASVREDISRAEVTLRLPRLDDEASTIGYSLKHLKLGAEKTVWALTFTDITQILKDRRSMEKIRDELAQSKKLASIGTMISGVAHELNNPLTGISMSAELSRRTLEKTLQALGEQNDAAPVEAAELSTRLEKTLSEINKITRSCDKAAALVGDLLSYAKPTTLDTRPVELVSLVEETMGAMRSHPHFGQFAMGIISPGRPYMVRADRLKLEQVLYNLFKNACDAAPQGIGRLEVSFGESAPLEPGGPPMVTTHVRDYGPGIDKTVLGRIFDPFFSTKGNQGVGLGLSISYRTIEQHGGLLRVESEQGHWTEFQIILPILADETDETNPHAF